MSIHDDYVYGTVEDPTYIADHASDNRDYVNKGMRFIRKEDRAFAMAALDYFHRMSPVRLTKSAADKALKLLPRNVEWRQGASSHNLAIWPDDPDPEKMVWDAYFGADAIVVGDFHHGSYTWFCIMAHAFFLDLIEQRCHESVTGGAGDD